MSTQGQTSNVTGHGNIVVQAQGSGVNVTIEAGRPHLRLTRFENRARRAARDTHDAALLSAYREDVVPLLGREAVMADLRQWLTSPADISVRVLVGAGGRGKTRLALELARVIAAEGWLAGFAEREELDRFRDQKNVADWGWDRPVLIVVDYAASRADQLRAWLRELIDAPEGRPPLRLLLVERQAIRDIGWLATIAGHGEDEASNATISLLDPPEPVQLPALDDLATRRAIFAALLARAEGAPEPPRPGEDAAFDRLLRDEKWASDPLFLMMAGLVAGEVGFAAALSLSRTDLAMKIGHRELNRIGDIAASDTGNNAGADGFARHLAALATLGQGLPARAARELAEAERARIGSPASVNEALAALADNALPAADGGIAPIQPDIIGEAAILIWLADPGGLKRWRLEPEASVAAVAEMARAKVCETLVRLAQDFAPAGRAEPVAWLGRLARAAETDLGALMVIADHMPGQTMALRDLAASLHETIAGQLRSLVAAFETGNGSAAPPELESMAAAALNNLGNRYSQLGRREEALAAARDAVVIRRRLAAARPDAFEPDLASSLNNLGNRYSQLGRREEALAAARDAVDIRRRLAAARPDAFEPDLASSLNNLGNRYSELGRREEALAAAREAVDIRRRLAAARPDAFEPDLASSLNNLGNRYSELGRREEALAAAREAVDIRRRLAAARPDAFEPDLASSLNNLGNRYSELGRREEALAAVREAVSVLCRSFLASPQAFAQWMTPMCRNYLKRCEEAGAEPDPELLSPVVEALAPFLQSRSNQQV